MNKSNVTIFIVDDDPAVRDALSLMITQEDFKVISFSNAEEFLNAVQPEHLGCAIIDIQMPGMNGMQLQEVISNTKILLPIIFLTGHGDIPLSVKAIKAGAVDFLTKPVTREKLLTSIETAILESERIMEENQTYYDALFRLKDLTDRERDVMALAIQGQPNKEIARSLGISHRTVEIHKSKIMHKTGAINLLDLARLANEVRIKNPS